MRRSLLLALATVVLACEPDALDRVDPEMPDVPETPETPKGTPAIRAVPGALDFGTILAGDSATLELRVENPGDAPLALEGGRIEGSAAFTAAVPAGAIAAGASRVLTVTFTPSAAGLLAADLVLASDADPRELRVPLAGTGRARDEVACPGGQCTPSCDAIRLSDTPGLSGGAQIVNAGGELGVFWLDIQAEPQLGELWDFGFARVDSAGVPSSAAWGFTSDHRVAHRPRAAWNGDRFGLAWSDIRTGDNELFFQSPDLDGPANASEVQLTSVPGAQFMTNIAWNPDHREYGLVWSDYRGSPAGPEIYFARLDATGAMIGVETRITTDAAGDMPEIAWTGDAYALAWHDGRSRTGQDIYFARVAATGELLGAELRVTVDGTSAVPSLAWNGTEHGVAFWSTRNGKSEAYFVRISRDGVKLGDEVSIGAPQAEARSPVVIAGGPGFALAWSDDRTGKSQIYAAHADAAGAIFGEVRVTCGDSSATNPSIARDAGGYAVAWTDDRDGNAEVYLTLLR